jgi:hypothetical protein
MVNFMDAVFHVKIIIFSGYFGLVLMPWIYYVGDRDSNPGVWGV